MANTDIDKILRDIKRRKELSRNTGPVTISAENTEPAEDKAERTVETAVVPQEKGKEGQSRAGLSEKSKQTLSDFINNSMEKQPDRDDVFAVSENISKKSEDYIDDGFMEFFTSSVIVTKNPEHTGKLDIKRKKNGLFRRGYVTDSLSLNMEKLEDEEKKLTRKQQRRLQKEKEREETASLPLVRKYIEDSPDALTEETEKPRTKKEKSRPENQEYSAIETSIIKPDEEIKVYSPPVQRQGLSAILGDDKDAESLAKRILRQRKPGGVAIAEKNAAEQLFEKETDKAADKEVKEATTKEIIPIVPKEEDGIINSIYTAIIEKQAREALADDVTGFIPEFEDDEEEKNVSPLHISEQEEDEEVFEEYISKSEFFDKPDDESRDIQSELISFRSTLNIRMILGFACGGILTYFNMAAQKGLPMPAFIDPLRQPLMFTFACILIYGIAFVGFLPTVLSGFKALQGIPAPDSLVSLGTVLAMVQLVVMAVISSKTDISQITVFAGFICIALGFNAMGKKIATNTIIKNLTLADAPSGINAGYIVNDTDRVKRLARTLDEKVPKILVSRKTGAITNFVQAGFSVHNSDYLARKLAAVSYGVVAVCFVMGLVVSKNLATAVFSAAGAAAMTVPLSRTLVNSVPSALMQKTLEKVGALVNGWQGIDQLSKTTHVNFDAKHLFPRGTVILHGIKTFEKERIDLAILYGASVLIQECEVLKPVFMEVIDGKTDILPKVDSCEYIELQGYVSWINNNRVIIGNRTLMEKYDVDMPPVSMENKFINQGRKPVYLAVGGKLFGMFVFSYRPDEIVKENLQRLMDKGVSVILSSKDFNIDPALIETVYGIGRDYVSVLNQKEATLISQFTDYSKESQCCVAHLESLSSLVAGFCGAESAKSAENVCSTIQAISVAIGRVLAVLFTYSQTIMHLPLISILLLYFGFMGIAMLTAVAKKYE